MSAYLRDALKTKNISEIYFRFSIPHDGKIIITMVRANCPLWNNTGNHRLTWFKGNEDGGEMGRMVIMSGGDEQQRQSDCQIVRLSYDPIVRL